MAPNAVLAARRHGCSLTFELKLSTEIIQVVVATHQRSRRLCARIISVHGCL